MPRVRSARLIATLLAGTTAGCQDTLKPDSAGGGSAAVSLVYVCDNDFDLRSLSPTALTVRYSVSGRSEQGELLLPPRPAESTPSTTRLTTLHRGTLNVSYRNDAFPPVGNPGITCPRGDRQEPQATSGEWTTPFDWPVVAVHLHLLPSGQVLSWGRAGEPQVWDPVDRPVHACGQLQPAVLQRPHLPI